MKKNPNKKTILLSLVGRTRRRFLRPTPLGFLVALLLSHMFLISCDDSWLEEKRDIKLAIPTSLEDMRALFGNSNVFQYDFRGFADPLADECFVADAFYLYLEDMDKNVYGWKRENFYAGKTHISDWDDGYNQVFIANVALEGLASIELAPGQVAEWKDVKGSALVYRARAFYNLAQLFCAPYNAATATTQAGIPLRLVSDVNAPVRRSTVEETYRQIIEDLMEAATLLRVTPEVKIDPSRPAAFGLLARTYLSMREYELAGMYADSCLQLYHTLIDYNAIDGNLTYPFLRFNEEVIMHGSVAPNYLGTSVLFGAVYPEIQDLYDPNDLRGQLFFRTYLDANKTFWGSYTGSGGRFSGIAVDEMMLIRAEWYARSGQVEAAMEDVNTLLETRYEAGTFVPLTAADVDEALSIVLLERRKQLILRGLRWTDLRRLNMETEHAVTLERQAEGETYTLPPGDHRYVLPIPDYVIGYSGIEQNP